jgi:hypothetical protein
MVSCQAKRFMERCRGSTTPTHTPTTQSCIHAIAARAKTDSRGHALAFHSRRRDSPATSAARPSRSPAGAVDGWYDRRPSERQSARCNIHGCQSPHYQTTSSKPVPRTRCRSAQQILWFKHAPRRFLSMLRRTEFVSSALALRDWRKYIARFAQRATAIAANIVLLVRSIVVCPSVRGFRCICACFTMPLLSHGRRPLVNPASNRAHCRLAIRIANPTAFVARY